jgi:glyoxylase-like metal-dependent hydrolase (beta-lactamase superfamily II)
MKAIHPNVFPIVTLASNCYLVRSQDGALLIDVGLNGSLKMIRSRMVAAGIDINALRLILISHADGDHYGGLAALKALATKAVICASQPEADAMAKGQMSRPLKARGIQGFLFRLISPFFKSPPVKVDRVINPGDSFAWLGGLVTLDSRGHTPGHLSFYSKSTGILFAGDSILVHGEKVVPAHGSNCWDEALGKEAFDRQLALKPTAILGGHGISSARNTRDVPRSASS